MDELHRRVQAALAAMGYDLGTEPKDDNWGTQSKSSLADFQTRMLGITTHPAPIDAATLEALGIS